MRATRRTVWVVGSALVGVIVGATLVVGADTLLRDGGTPEGPSPVLSPVQVVAKTSVVLPSERILLAWVPGAIPLGTATRIRNIPGVREATTVTAGLEWMARSRLPNGTVLDKPPRGYRIPVEVAVIDPKGYETFVPPADQQLVEALGKNEMLMARTEEELRGAGTGLRLDFGRKVVSVAGVVGDVATEGYEGLMRGPVPASWAQPNRFVLMRLTKSADRRAIEARIHSLLPPGTPLRVKAKGETPFLRYGDAVLPQMLIKKTFGEFAARPIAGGRIEIDPSWIKDNIETGRVPLLGDVTCHRLLFPQLRQAMREVRATGLAGQINDFAGCFSPRFIVSDPHAGLSHHSWGIGVDINAAENRYGAPPTQDGRIVDVMERYGFTWGGRWLVPDGMHFEWTGFP